MRKVLIDAHTHTVASGHAYSSLQEMVRGTITWKYYAYAKNTMFLPFSVVTLISRSKLLTMTDSFRFWLKQISQTNLS